MKFEHHLSADTKMFLLELIDKLKELTNVKVSIQINIGNEKESK